MGILDWFKSPPPKPRPAGDPLVLAKQEEVVQALARLPHIRELTNGGYVDLVHGTLITVTPFTSEPPYLLLTYSGSNQILLCTVAVLERYLAVQQAVAHLHATARGGDGIL